ncbi:MAG: hypothetical protein HOD92_10250 [Deltaproteobacteria bacterium]|jgi:hypothetical protein|nr:hypothetical protein [Deltaproteobacteria bacterium]
MKKVGLFFAILLIFTQLPIFAADFVSKDVDGTLIYKCVYCCHRIRIFKLGEGRYRVYSISFAGIVEAESPLKAARIACKEDKTN